MHCKRLGVFVFYDKDGIVDGYIDYLLNDLSNCLDKLIVVCNGALNEQGKQVFLKYTNDVFLRENVGFDAAAWQYVLIEKLGIERKYIRHELFGEMHNPSTQEDYTKPNVDKVKITIHSKGEVKEIEANVDDTILQSLEKAGIAAPNRCRSGECGFCRALLLKGNVYIPKALEYRRYSDKHFNWIHNCSTYPLEDIEIELA